MCNATLRDDRSAEAIRLDVNCLSEMMKIGRMQSFSHVERKDENDCLRRVKELFEADRPRMAWNKVGRNYLSNERLWRLSMKRPRAQLALTQASAKQSPTQAGRHWTIQFQCGQRWVLNDTADGHECSDCCPTAVLTCNAQCSGCSLSNPQ